MSTIIRELIAEPLDLPLREPFKVATGSKDSALNVLVRVVLEDGTTGYGKVSPSPYTTGDTRETVLAVLDALRPVVVGRDVRCWRGVLNETRKRIRNQVAAHSGLEIAGWTPSARRKGSRWPTCSAASARRSRPT